MHVPIRRVNDGLLALIILINGYIIAAPFLPKLEFWWQTKHTSTQTNLAKQVHAAGTGNLTPTSQPNHVVVPSMVLNTPILEGALGNRYKVLNSGIWRWPLGSTPDKGGNTVLIGHRFTYTNPRGVFYFLNKVALGDEIGIVWNNKNYTYKVSSITEVPPTDTAIQDATPNAQITLFTCTPLWQPKDRLVVVAQLEGSL